jgi:sulfur carrier protein
MEITINSRPRQIDACLTLSDVMRDEGLYDKGGVAVAVNGRVVRRAQWDTCMLADGADIIIINAAYGG